MLIGRDFIIALFSDESPAVNIVVGHDWLAPFTTNDLVGEFITALKEPANVTNYVKPNTETFKIEAIVDKNILEVFVNDGELYYVMPFDGPKTGKITAFSKGPLRNWKTILKRMHVSELRSIWTNANSQG